ncbi:hypothetical protein H483_0116390 [Dietzia sp. UCD-THP]|uniref:hypothetical protein n=1 Tax=Dietzia sp. UCD-THP TaxID=1292020 RepID=UPI00036698CC|nr:hypothetical protein [Dietzia sp. UCD-THP]EYT56957.1 hypothetical protein H483_0116390 [Dietzia sp. UCD-THP]
MSHPFSFRRATTVLAALTLAAGLAPSASAQPAETWRAPFPPPAPIPSDAWFVDSQTTVGPGEPGFWEPGPIPLRVISQAPADSPTWCTAYWSRPGERCWQVGPDGRATELRRFSVLSDLWNGSSASWGRDAYRAGYRIAIDRGWDYNSGGIFVPTGSGTTYSTMMPLGADSPDADVWVAPGALPGS